MGAGPRIQSSYDIEFQKRKLQASGTLTNFENNRLSKENSKSTFHKPYFILHEKSYNKALASNSKKKITIFPRGSSLKTLDQRPGTAPLNKGILTSDGNPVLRLNKYSGKEIEYPMIKNAAADSTLGILTKNSTKSTYLRSIQRKQ